MEQTIKPTVSVIIPVYNHQDYITDAINSILRQTYQDFEIIVVDDGSIDNSLEKSKQFIGKVKHIKVIHHEQNKGISSARNAGIKESCGKYIAFLSSDDVWCDTFLEEMVRGHKKNSIVFCDYTTMSANGGKIKEIQYMKTETPIKFKIESFKNEVISKAKTHGMFVNYSCIFGEKKFFVKKYSFLDKIRYGEDLYHLLKVSGVANFIYLPKSLVKYRCHKQSMTQKFNHNIHNNNKQIFTYLREEGYDLKLNR